MKTERTKIPEHVAIIMDGNGRWARKRRMPRTYGHLRGVKRVDEIVAAARRMGVKVLTLFAFSSENWQRPKSEVDVLLKTLVANLKSKVAELQKADIRLCFIGRRDGVPEIVLKNFDEAQERTRGNRGMILNVAFNYGARQEIVDAARDLCARVQKGEVDRAAIDEGVFARSLYTKDLPDPDLLIRTSGEKRISNFLLWQLSYSELYFTEKFWPDFDEKEFMKALVDFQKRERRYGRINA